MLRHLVDRYPLQPRLVIQVGRLGTLTPPLALRRRVWPRGGISTPTIHRLGNRVVALAPPRARWIPHRVKWGTHTLPLRHLVIRPVVVVLHRARGGMHHTHPQAPRHMPRRRVWPRGGLVTPVISLPLIPNRVRVFPLRLPIRPMGKVRLHLGTTGEWGGRRKVLPLPTMVRGGTTSTL